MSEFRRYIVLLFCLLTGCARIPDSYAPPVQRNPLTATETEGAGHFVNMGEPNSDTYIIRDVTDSVEGGTWRWTRKRPELRFFLESTEQLNFKADIAISEVTLKDTGPVAVSVLINGHLLDTLHAAEPGVKQIDKPVPPSFLRAKTFNVVVMEIDKAWVAKDDGAILGFILIRAGFTQ